MSNSLVTDVQKQEPGSELIDLFELEYDSGQYLYMHSGLTENLDLIRFRDRIDPSIIRRYVAMPIEITGVELNSDGAQNRPTLTIANVATTFKDLLEGYTNDDLVGKRIIKRQTLRKYLYGEVSDTNPPFEFPIKSFVIDRMSAENPVSVEFELASPFDLSGVQIPSRIVIGKYCSWIYQGAAAGKGGCTWPTNSTIHVPNSLGNLIAHTIYFNQYDEPFVKASVISGAWLVGTTYPKDVYVSDITGYWVSRANGNLGNIPGTDTIWWKRAHVGTEWSGSGVSYTTESYVEYSNTAWKAKIAHLSTTSNFPFQGSKLWERADICGKQLNSCKARFQFTPIDPETVNSAPSIDTDTTKAMPFGAFPGSLKFR